MNSTLETILIAEDEQAMREHLTRAFITRGYTVFQADRGTVALSIVNFLQGEIDLLITDIVMPEMDGIELAQLLQKRYQNKFGIIFSTGFSGVILRAQETIENCDIMSKPFHLVELVNLAESKFDNVGNNNISQIEIDAKIAYSTMFNKVFSNQIPTLNPKKAFGNSKFLFAELTNLGLSDAHLSDLADAIKSDQGGGPRPKIGQKAHAWISDRIYEIGAIPSTEEKEYKAGHLYQITFGFFGYFR